jgi:DNA replication protein DnaC
VRQFGDQVQTWETWAPRAELEEQVKALRAWRGTEYWATLLWGGVGTGKTHALQATGHEWLGRGFDVRYTVVPEYFDRLRRSFNDDTMRVPELGEFEGLLLLDELGSDKQTEWTTGVLERAIGLRYRCGFPTLIATNLELNALGVHFPRLADRLFEGALLHWQAPSWRRR